MCKKPLLIFRIQDKLFLCILCFRIHDVISLLVISATRVQGNYSNLYIEKKRNPKVTTNHKPDGLVHLNFPVLSNGVVSKSVNREGRRHFFKISHSSFFCGEEDLQNRDIWVLWNQENTDLICFLYFPKNSEKWKITSLSVSLYRQRSP